MRMLVLAAAVASMAACGPEEAADYDDADEAVPTPAVTTGTVDPAATTTAPTPGASLDTAGMSGTQRATGTDADGPGQLP